jgi:flagellar biogenesis protein FliO
MNNDQQEHVTTTEARAGATPHMTRYVLSIGLVLVIVLFAIILFVAG